MGLSERVWSFVNQTKEEFELAIEVGMTEGRSAADLSRDVRQALREPAKLFRRVPDKETGQLRLSKAAQAYNPGRGVYRSSFKNALRLTATENNMAYRRSDHERWQNTPWVLGIEISTSTNNHEQEDICDELAGKYPKDFVFVGWHPFCRCFATPILPDEEEYDKYEEALIAGDDVDDFEFSGRVEDLPENFTEWCEENAERIENASSDPYFLRDNFEDGDPSNGPLWEKEREAVEGSGGIKGIEARTDITSRKAEKEGRQIYDSYDSTAQTKSYIDTNSRALAEKLGIEGDIQPRDFYDADDGLPNEIGGDSNCVNCAFANELLRRGLDVRASLEEVKEISEDNLTSMFLTKNGGAVTAFDAAKKAKGDEAAIKKAIVNYTNIPNGRFFISYNEADSVKQWEFGEIEKTDIEGHVFSAENTPDGLVMYDHQNDCFVSIDAVLNIAHIKDGIEIIRVDDKNVNLGNPYIRRLLQ